jgi:DNA-binding response OmpR family regulator
MRTQQGTILIDRDKISPKDLLRVRSYRFGSFIIDVPTRILIHNGKVTRLTEKESLLLILFAAYENQVVTKEAILLMGWGDVKAANLRSLDVYICKLRRLLSEDENVYIFCVQGKGFKLIC